MEIQTIDGQEKLWNERDLSLFRTGSKHKLTKLFKPLAQIVDHEAQLIDL